MDDKPLLDWDAIGLDRLGALPEGSLGRAYVEFLRANRLGVLRYASDPNLTDEEFFLRRVVQTHDLWHVVLGFATDPVGELGINAFMLAQLAWAPAGFYIGGYLLRQMLSRPGDAIAIVRSVADGWTLGQSARPLFAVRWETQLERSLEELRRELGVAGCAGRSDSHKEPR
jgi:ubiquinone biosynthesis protein Coq4